jgi:hypothetical protein
MDPNMFDKVIAELGSLEAQIAAINARPFMPETPSQISIRMRQLASGDAKPKQSVPSSGAKRKKTTRVVKPADNKAGR